MEQQRTAEPEGAEKDPPGVFRRVHDRLHSNPITGMVTKVVITIIGVLVIAAGIFLSGPGIPGPGFLVVLGGLAILSTEYTWAKRVLDWARDRYESFRQRVEEMDPAVRRRRTLIGATAFALVVAAMVAYVVVFDWPGFAVSGWDWMQGLVGVLPELPGM